MGSKWTSFSHSIGITDGTVDEIDYSGKNFKDKMEKVCSVIQATFLKFDCNHVSYKQKNVNYVFACERFLILHSAQKPGETLNY